MSNNYDQTSLDTLLLRHKVTITAVYNCAAINFSCLCDMEKIFDLKTAEDIKLLVTIPELFFTKTEAQSIIAYFLEEEKSSEFLAAAEPDLEKYKILLLSAFVYNPSFFSMAWNWCVFIQGKIRKGQPKPKLELVKNEKNSRRPDGSTIWELDRRIDRKVAASAGNRQFGEAVPLEGIGELYQFVEEVEGRYYFQFALAVTSEQLSRPFVLEVEFTTMKDGKNHKIKIEDNPDEPEQTIWSSRVEDVDVSRGIEIHQVEFRPV